MSYQSLPISPAPPSESTYGFQALSLFQYADPANLDQPITLTRALFLKLTGAQAPVYNPSRPTQNWFDQSAVPGFPNPGSYLVIPSTTGSIAPTVETIPVPADVSMPNLPGQYQYAPWVNSASSPAILSLPGGVQPTTVNGTELCSLADAQAVAAALPTGTTITEDPLDQNITWNGETRRMYLVNVPGGPSFFAALLRTQMTQIINDPSGNYVSGGVGAPGSFTISSGNAVWAPTPDPGLSATPAGPIPIRPLLPTETIVPGLLGTWEISNSGSTPTPAPTADGFSAADRTMLTQNNQILLGLAKIYNIGVS